MKKIDTLLRPTWIIPIEPINTILTDHELAIDNGKIVGLLPTEQAKLKYIAKEIIELDDHVIMPGFVNAHTHSPLSLLRGIANDLSLMIWLNNHVWPAEKKWLSEEFVKDGTKLAIAEMLKNGTTCFHEHYFFPAQIGEVVAKTGIRATLGFAIIDNPTSWSKDGRDAIAKGLEVYQEYKNSVLINTSFAPHAPYSVSDETFISVRNYSEQFNMPIHVHIHETKDEINQSIEKYGKRPLKRLQDLGLLSKNFQNVHMTQVIDEDIEILQKTGSHVIHCPESNLKLASGFCPAQKLLDAGINIALGTDSVVSNNDLNMISEMRTAALLAKGTTKQPTSLTAFETLRMATLNGAIAMGLDQEIGSLKPGKSADIISIDMNTLATQPIYNPIAQIVYSAGHEQIKNLWVAGKRLLKNGQLTNLSEYDIINKTKEWNKRILRDKQ